GGTLKGEVVSVTANTSGGAVGEKDKLSDQFILFAKADSPNAQYVKDLKAGDSVNIAVEETLDAAKEIMEKANSVITNVGWLVKDGKDLTREEDKIGTHEVTMMARWTAFGTKEDGSYVFFTTDSVEDDATYTTGSSVCVTLRDVAKAMIGMGCTNVIRMDGGGSTAMYAKDSGSGTPGYLMYASREVGDCILVVKRSSMNKDKTAKEDLTKLVNELKDNDKASYKETVAAAKAILESKTSTSADYVRAYVALNVVTDAYKKLEVGIAAADKADKQEYAPTIWDKLTKLNADAKKAKDDKTITADEVIALEKELSNAIQSIGAVSLVVSRGCSYTHGTAVDTATYPDTGNKELTDGDLSVDTDGYAPGWVGAPKGKGFKVTIDLGEEQSDLSVFTCRAL
ncbi:MAG: phosphodiester glycosidase family protein, partial [Clostridiales bacterium]|nr:phosphodiester glycosidase family protein [Candidatus Coliplasma caballi]